MNKNKIIALLGAFGLLAVTNAANAIPTLQLDIGGGTYCDETCPEPLINSVITTDTSFSLYAYANPDGEKSGPKAITLEDILGNTNVDFFLSIALTPKTTSDGGNYGSIKVNGTDYDVTGDMTYGKPPLTDLAKDIAGHSIYDTWYREFAVSFNSLDQSCDYNVQDDPGIGPQPLDGSCSTMYFDTFNIDMSNLAEGFNLHFDLYAIDTTADNFSQTLVDFAPWSHDAQTDCCTKVPEPGTAFLLGLGLLGFGMRKRIKL